MLNLLYFIILHITIPTHGADLIDIIHHKIFGSCVFDILSNFDHHYFKRDNLDVGTIFILDRLDLAAHIFQRNQNAPEVNLVSLSPRYAKPCLIFLIDMYAVRFFPFLDIVLEGISYANLDPHFILLQTDWSPPNFLARFRLRPYWVSSAILLWHQPTKNLFRICVSCREPILIDNLSKFSRRSLRIVPKIEKSISWFIHVEGPRRPPRPEMTSCSQRYWKLNTRFTTCVPFELSTYLNYSLEDTENHRPLGWVHPGELAGRNMYEYKFFHRRVVRMKLLNYATEYTEYHLVFYTGRGGSLDFLKLFEPLDTWIWVGLVLTFLATLGFVYAMSETRGSVGDALFTVFSVLLDQSQYDPEEAGAGKILRNKITILITAWTLTLSTILTCYKGDLLSYFVLETLPSTPDTIEDLVASDILITTNTRHYGYNSEIYSSLKDYVLSHLAQGND
ncbi:hypothetical protein Fcan01_11639 [Folsomia candida]|uniref:Uncharacterized protein n=1 Tax=Folsomia candida TaxID=158441 RepID=A0A226E9N8_FOLCA|nr:hypothetical protein Fcan01_11639 [Folsomia candida]